MLSPSTVPENCATTKIHGDHHLWPLQKISFATWKAKSFTSSAPMCVRHAVSTCRKPSFDHATATVSGEEESRNSQWTESKRTGRSVGGAWIFLLVRGRENSLHFCTSKARVGFLCSILSRWIFALCLVCVGDVGRRVYLVVEAKLSHHHSIPFSSTHAFRLSIVLSILPLSIAWQEYMVRDRTPTRISTYPG